MLPIDSQENLSCTWIDTCKRNCYGVGYLQQSGSSGEFHGTLVKCHRLHEMNKVQEYNSGQF